MTHRSRHPMLGFLWLLLGAYAAGCAHNPPPSSADGGVVRGTVAYRERMALPPDAVVEVWIVDVSPLIMAAAIIAETTVQPEGRQVPLPFELRHDPGRIEPDHTYAVKAAIRSAGRIMFATEATYHVITKGNPTRVNLMLVHVSGVAESASSGLLRT